MLLFCYRRILLKSSKVKEKINMLKRGDCKKYGGWKQIWQECVCSLLLYNCVRIPGSGLAKVAVNSDCDVMTG